MNRRNPIDRFFKRKLQYHEVEAPMALWERIDAHRERQKLQVRQARRRQGVLLSFLLAASATLSSPWWFADSAAVIPEMSSFPIEVAPAAPTNETPAVAALSRPSATPAPPTSLPVIKRRSTTLLPDLPDVLSVDKAPPANRPDIAPPAAETPLAAESMTPRRPTVTSPALLPASPLQIGRKGKYSEDIRCAEFDPAEKNRWSVEVLASPDWSFRRLEPKAAEYTGYVEDRKRTESPDFNYSLGARLSYVHPSGALARVGFNYARINEKFEYQTENEEVITIRNVFGPNGDVVGTDTLIETSIRRSYTNNRFTSVDIPVIIGYQKEFRKYSLAVQAGVLFNISFQSEGDFLSPMDGEPVSFDERDPGSYPAFRDQLGVGIYAGLSLAYAVGPKTNLLVEPHLRTYPQTITRDQYVVNQQYLLTGLSIGLRQYF